jgi:hypothetical protein
MVQLLHRAANNPIITAADLPYPANAVFNPGAARRGWERRRSSCCEWRTCGASRMGWEVQDRLRRANPGPLDAPDATIRTRPMHPTPAHHDPIVVGLVGKRGL